MKITPHEKSSAEIIHEGFLKIESESASSENSYLQKYTDQLATTKQLRQIDRAFPNVRFVFASQPDTNVPDSLLFDPTAFELGWSIFLQTILEDNNVDPREKIQLDEKFIKFGTAVESLSQIIQNEQKKIFDFYWDSNFATFTGQNLGIRNFPDKKRVLISYFFKECGPCLKEIRATIAQARIDPTFVAIFANTNLDDRPTAIFKSIGINPKDLPPNIHFVHDSNKTMDRAVAPTQRFTTPLSFGFDMTQSKLFWGHVGFSDASELTEFFEHQ